MVETSSVHGIYLWFKKTYPDKIGVLHWLEQGFLHHCFCRLIQKIQLTVAWTMLYTRYCGVWILSIQSFTHRTSLVISQSLLKIAFPPCEYNEIPFIYSINPRVPLPAERLDELGARYHILERRTVWSARVWFFDCKQMMVILQTNL